MTDKRGFDEPSVLDYVKSKLSFGRGVTVEIPGPRQVRKRDETPVSQPPSPLPWRSLLALGLALFAQGTFEPPHPTAATGLFSYLAALGLLIWAWLRGEWKLSPPPPAQDGRDPQTFHGIALLLAAIFALLAYLSLGGNLFTGLNLTLWLLAIGLFIRAFWLRGPGKVSIWQRMRAFFASQNWQISVTRWELLLLAATVLVVFFRVYLLTEVPAEPFSDHAEKILDVYDLTQGQTHIFFPRNTGREGFQMYWTVLVAWAFGTGLSFLSLKIGTALLGLFTLPYIYLLGKEIGNPRVGLLALLFAGIGYWPNVISRMGLRFPLYPLFVAPMLLYLLRGLRTRNRNDFILSGLFLGLGLHGYSPFRIMPFAALVAVGLYLLHAQSKGARRDALLWLVILAMTSFFVFLPLLRYALDNPGTFSYRAISRLEGVEQPLLGPWYQVLLSNLWNALRMFNWDDGDIWVNSLPHRPALDVVCGALFLIGVILVLIRYLRDRHWLDLFLLLSIPLLQLPSILSLAFPAENPALNRAAGALVPAFLLAALALDGLLTGLGSGKGRVLLTWGVTAVLLFWSAAQNFDLVFNKFDQNFRSGAWNSSEMGAVIKQFGQTYGTTDTAWVVPYPYWVDTRLPGVWAGIPNRDFAMWPENLPGTLNLPGPKLFIFWSKDTDTESILRNLYPNGQLSRYTSRTPGKDFMIFFVPGQ